jgi:large subunit ribosomal protein L10
MDNEEQKISKNRQKKISIVADLEQKLEKSAAIVFTNYQGLTHKQLEGLRKAIKPLEAEFVVAKNSLILRALNSRKMKLDSEKDLEGPTGTLFIYGDIVSPLKELAKLIKELGIPSVKFGIMEGNRISKEDVLKLSVIPSREVLLAQLAVFLKAPIYGLHRALNWNLQKLVMTLGAVAKAKPADASPAGANKPAKQTQSESAIQSSVNEKEPETILDETIKEEMQEKPTDPIAKPAEIPVEQLSKQTQENNSEEKNEGGEN